MKHNRFNLIIMLLIVVMMTAMLVGCGGPNVDKDKDNENDKENDVAKEEWIVVEGRIIKELSIHSYDTKTGDITVPFIVRLARLSGSDDVFAMVIEMSVPNSFDTSTDICVVLDIQGPATIENLNNSTQITTNNNMEIYIQGIGAGEALTSSCLIKWTDAAREDDVVTMDLLIDISVAIDEQLTSATSIYWRDKSIATYKEFLAAVETAKGSTK